MNARTLQQIDWILHIERESFIFYNTIFFKVYGSLMKKGTGFGFTKVLKDGDLAEVDAEKGIIKKLV